MTSDTEPRINTVAHLLLKLSEESVEVSKECHKALIFGLDDRKTLDPTTVNTDPNEPTNREKIMAELDDLYSTVGLLVDRGILPRMPEVRAAKLEKITDFHGYSVMVGVTVG